MPIIGLLVLDLHMLSRFRCPCCLKSTMYNSNGSYGQFMASLCLGAAAYIWFVQVQPERERNGDDSFKGSNLGNITEFGVVVLRCGQCLDCPRL